MVNIKAEATKDDIREYWKVYYDEKIGILSIKEKKLNKAKSNLEKAEGEGNDKKVKRLEKELKKIAWDYNKAREETDKIKELNTQFNENKFILKKVRVPDSSNMYSMIEKDSIVFVEAGYIFKPTSDKRVFYDDVKLVRA